MSAPKTPEGRAASLAKRRESQRSRPIAELCAATATLGTQFKYAELRDETCSYRPDLHAVGGIISMCANFARESPASEEVTEQLEHVRHVLIDLFYARRCQEFGVFRVDYTGVQQLQEAIKKRSSELRAIDNPTRSDGVIDLAKARKARAVLARNA